MSYPCWFREVDCDSEVLFLCLPPVRLWLMGTGLPRCCHSNALLLCFLFVFLNFLLISGDRMSEMRLKPFLKSKPPANSKQVFSMLSVAAKTKNKLWKVVNHICEHPTKQKCYILEKALLMSIYEVLLEVSFEIISISTRIIFS